nr:immunoglobulin light chain junction region [Macaca mulatta]MOX07334.1 immunoglobulin light chain junction region [Macaca mulatta]MOX07432.1 immunoglobulin light chain junction region [Macaca mulatta]
CQHSYGTPYTF